VKQIAKKPVAKPKTAKKAALVDKDDNAGSDAEMLSDGSPGASDGIRAIPEGPEKTASEKYTKVQTPLFHSTLLLNVASSSHNLNIS
jgi:hypothetical protein